VGLDTEPVDQVTQQLEKPLAVGVRNKHGLARRATIHDVVPRTLKFDSQRTSHENSLSYKAQS